MPVGWLHSSSFGEDGMVSADHFPVAASTSNFSFFPRNVSGSFAVQMNSPTCFSCIFCPSGAMHRACSGAWTVSYRNAVSLFLKDGRRFECEDDSLCGESFFLASVPHRKREEGFPLDRLSVDERTGAYYYDSGERAAGDAFEGFRRFFAVCFGL